ncbi:MAG: hypothetical protein ACR5LF_11530 [Symbiopectobacterium sp.]
MDVEIQWLTLMVDVRCPFCEQTITALALHISINAVLVLMPSCVLNVRTYAYLTCVLKKNLAAKCNM